MSALQLIIGAFFSQRVDRRGGRLEEGAIIAAALSEQLPGLQSMIQRNIWTNKTFEVEIK